MDYTQTILDGESVKVIFIRGTERNTSLIYIDSSNNLKIKVKPVEWSDFSPVQNRVFGLSAVLNTATESLTTVADWTDLETLEPATEGDEAFVTSISGSTFGRSLARRDAIKWFIPGSDTNSQTYINSNQVPIPIAPLATPSLWFGPNWQIAGGNLLNVRSYKTVIKNNTGKTWLTVAPLFNFISNTPGTIIGWRVRNDANDGAWTSGTIQNQSSYTPPSGNWDFSNRLPVLTDSAQLLNPVLNNQYLTVECVLSGDYSYGNISINTYPNLVMYSFRSADTENCFNVEANWTDGYAMPFSHLYIETNPAQGSIRKIIVGGDSLTAQVRPIADENAGIREGYAYVSNNLAISNNVAINICSFGQGTATIGQMKQMQTNLTSAIGNKIDWAFMQGWSYNDTPADQAGENAVKDDVDACKAIWESYAVRTGAIFMSPPGIKRHSTEELTVYNNLRTYFNTDPNKFIDLSPSVADTNDSTLFNSNYTQDDVHINEAGSTPHGQLMYTEVIRVLQAASEI